jgi:hypothetical protein
MVDRDELLRDGVVFNDLSDIAANEVGRRCVRLGPAEEIGEGAEEPRASQHPVAVEDFAPLLG